MYLFIYYMFNIYMLLIKLVLVLISVAFVTLFERKVLGYIHYRKGPNKVGVIGIFQPFSDAMKLFMKESMKCNKVHYYYLITPIFMMMLMLMIWLYCMNFYELSLIKLSLLMMFCLLGLGVYPFLISGWASGCIYSMLGSVRSGVQVISYEVSLILIIMSLVIMMETYSLLKSWVFQEFIWFLFMLPIFIMFFSSILAELNRTPFDFVEGESELVSGFNTEYHGGGFALIFIAEYGMLLFMGLLIGLMFTSLKLNNYLFYIISMIFIIMIIWIRGVLPRMRYDELMYMCWKNFLPIALNWLIMVINLKMLVYIVFM